LRIIPAICPNCSSNLIGVTGYLNFFCTHCGENFTLKGNKLEKREIIFFKNDPEGADTVFLLFKLYKIFTMVKKKYFKYSRRRLIPTSQKEYFNIIVPNFIVKTIDKFFKLNPFNPNHTKSKINVICFGGVKETICLNTLKLFTFTELIQSGHNIDYDDLYISIKDEKEIALPFKIEYNYLISKNFKFSIDTKSIINFDKFTKY
jgi:hypothetical protein